MRSSTASVPAFAVAAQPSARFKRAAFWFENFLEVLLRELSVPFPAGGLKWTRTTDLTLIRRAL